ncbi:TetR family transcriptional regulator [Roseomonas sp. NAR14]|uniref:TetR family transcriptional regulator n=1 Tax=Roseomonas acroporae TaxID=2937791 RepID=A0A9X1YAP5_9PROT|nr:TetR family transcriptional regulator [Roseomonas acroporae]MCK8786969.1 TetR family transcriptional regulator [Roseomonas acroporae]
MSDTESVPFPPGGSATDPAERAIAAFWEVVARHGWQGATMGRIARAAALDLGALRGIAPTAWHLLRLHAARVDQAVLAGTVPGQGGSPRDRVFDVLMRRFDALLPYRAGVLRFMDDLPRDPLAGLAVTPLLLCSMGWMLEAAELDPRGPAGALRTKGLLGIWLAGLRAWRADDSVDLGTTMAALDRAIERAEKVARTLRLGPGDRSVTAEGDGPSFGETPDDAPPLPAGR